MQTRSDDPGSGLKVPLSDFYFTLLTPDRPILLSSVCSTLVGVSSRILDYTWQQGELDTLWSPLHSVSSLHQLGRSMSRSVVGP